MAPRVPRLNEITRYGLLLPRFPRYGTQSTLSYYSTKTTIFGNGQGGNVSAKWIELGDWVTRVLDFGLCEHEDGYVSTTGALVAKEVFRSTSSPPPPLSSPARRRLMHPRSSWHQATLITYLSNFTTGTPIATNWKRSTPPHQKNSGSPTTSNTRLPMMSILSTPIASTAILNPRL